MTSQKRSAFGVCVCVCACACVCVHKQKQGRFFLQQLQLFFSSKHHTHARYINLKGCYRISFESVKKLCASLGSRLKVLDIRDCKLSPSQGEILELLQANDTKIFL